MEEKELYEKINFLFNDNKYNDVVSSFELNRGMINKYYHQINILYLKSLYELNEYQKCFQLVKEELEMPYIPLEYEDSYNIIFNDVTNSIKSNNSKIIASFTDEQIINEVFVNESEMAFPILSYLSDKNIRKYISNIKTYFEDPSKKNFYKILLLDMLSKQEVQDKFKIVTSYGSKIINPSDDNRYTFPPVIEEIYQSIDNSISDTSLIEITKELVMSLVINIFPVELEKKDINDVIAATVFYAYKLMNNPIDYEKLDRMFSYSKERVELFLRILKNDYEVQGN